MMHSAATSTSNRPLDCDQPHRVQDAEDGDAYIGKDGGPHVGEANGTEYEDEGFYEESEHDVLGGDADGFSGNADYHRDSQKIIVHDDDIGGFDCGIGSHGSHRNAYISAPKHRSVVDTVTDES